MGSTVVSVPAPCDGMTVDVDQSAEGCPSLSNELKNWVKELTKLSSGVFTTGGWVFIRPYSLRPVKPSHNSFSIIAFFDIKIRGALFRVCFRDP